MFVFLFRGREADAERFEALLDRHARWLGVRSDRMRLTLPGADVAVLGRVSDAAAPLAPTSDGTWVGLATGPRADPSDGLPAAGTEAPCELRVDRASGRVRIDAPLVTPEAVYWTEDGRGFAAGTDLRPLAAWTGARPHPVGLAALLQYGTVPAPWTAIDGVRRVPGGYRLDGTTSPGLERRIPPLSEWRRPVATDEIDVRTLAGLDRAVARVPDGAVVFFSGGTDSGLLAARLTALGRHATRLVHYSFGPGDVETPHAERMAALLGLRLRTVVHDPLSVLAIADTLGADYSLPFDDLSVIPTRAMIRAAEAELREAGAVVLGVGADDVYEGGLKVGRWRRLGRVPRAARRAVERVLRIREPWLLDDGLARTWGIARRSVLARHEFGAVVMHNDLAGLAYPYDPTVQARIEEAWGTSIDAFSGGLAPEDRLAWMYLVNGGMGWEAPKFDVLRRLEVRSYYPFLETAMLRHGFSLSWAQKCEGRKDKVLLKRLLERSVPPELVRRPKQGFSPPLADLYAPDAVQDLLRAELLDGAGPLAGSYDAAFAARLLDRARRASLRRTSLNFLWTVFFGSRWIGDVRRALGGSGSAARSG